MFPSLPLAIPPFPPSLPLPYLLLCDLMLFLQTTSCIIMVATRDAALMKVQNAIASTQQVLRQIFQVISLAELLHHHHPPIRPLLLCPLRQYIFAASSSASPPSSYTFSMVCFPHTLRTLSPFPTQTLHPNQPGHQCHYLPYIFRRPTFYDVCIRTNSRPTFSLHTFKNSDDDRGRGTCISRSIPELHNQTCP